MAQNGINKVAINELFDRVIDIITVEKEHKSSVNKMIHETLVLICAEGLRNEKQAFGNLFSQVDYLCKRHNVRPGDVMAIQNARRDSNKSAKIETNDVLYDCRALCIFISIVFSVDVPATLIGLIPAVNKPQTEAHRVDYRYIRGVIRSFDANIIDVETEQNISEHTIKVDYSADHLRYLSGILRAGMQLNLLDCELTEAKTLKPKLVIIEPDFLIDISDIACCFTDYGHNPLAYLVNRMSPNANSQAILLGNFAGKALDDVINSGDNEYKWTDSIVRNFNEKAVEYCSCEDLNTEKYKALAYTQATNIQQIVQQLFINESAYDREKAILEPSFVCEQLGIQGRVDLMTTDFKLLVEQKSGKNSNVERNFPNRFGSFQKEEHYVQLLLYYGILRQNFNLSNHQSDIYLLYSKYPLPGGLVSVNFYQRLFADAIEFRNHVVANEFDIATKGFDAIIDDITLAELNEHNDNSMFFERYIAPRLNEIISPLHNLSALERAYFCRMMTFVYQEQLAGKVGTQVRIGSNSVSDLWNVPLSEKRETGNIYTDLHVIRKERSDEFSGYDTITLSVPEQGEDFLPNFRRGDMVYLYSYADDKEPDVRANILHKGVIASINSDEIMVHLGNSQQNPNILSPNNKDVKYAIEHSDSDIGTRGMIKSLHAFIASVQVRKDLLLAQREPERDETITLSHSYNPTYDEVLTRAKQAKDYFLLIGPPGTGKTSMALRYIVEEELSEEKSNVLLMAYTNRAVDEICEALMCSDINFIRVSHRYASDERFHANLIRNIANGDANLNAARQKIADTRVFVGTTSSMMANASIFNIKQFTLAVIDEASQILEPNLVGLLSICHEGEPVIGKFILIGDHKQLPAVVRQDEATPMIDGPLLLNIGVNDCRMSLFERLLNWERAQNREQFVGTLRKQGRMHPVVADFPNKMFYAKEQLKPVPLPHQLQETIGYNLPSIDALDDLLKGHRMIFIPSKPCNHPNMSDKVNIDEARIVVDLLRRIHRFYGEGFNVQTTVGVIVPYRNQIAMIRKQITKLGIQDLDGVSIDTVERYQGSQRDVIIYSFTVLRLYQLDFLTSNCFVEDDKIIDRKLNVALTRARKQMIIIGNEALLSANTIFAEMIVHIKNRGGYVEL